MYKVCPYMQFKPSKLGRAQYTGLFEHVRYARIVQYRYRMLGGGQSQKKTQHGKIVLICS